MLKIKQVKDHKHQDPKVAYLQKCLKSAFDTSELSNGTQ